MLFSPAKVWPLPLPSCSASIYLDSARAHGHCSDYQFLQLALNSGAWKFAFSSCKCTHTQLYMRPGTHMLVHLGDSSCRPLGSEHGQILHKLARLAFTKSLWMNFYFWKLHELYNELNWIACLSYELTFSFLWQNPSRLLFWGFFNNFCTIS